MEDPESEMPEHVAARPRRVPVSHKESDRLVRRDAIRVRDAGSELLAGLKSDPDVTATLSPAEIDATLSRARYTKDVDAIFACVYGGR